MSGHLARLTTLPDYSMRGIGDCSSLHYSHVNQALGENKKQDLMAPHARL